MEKAILQVTNKEAAEDTGESPMLTPDQLDGKGCTAVVLFMKHDFMYCANAGDSRCVLAAGGKAIDLSEDHKPALPGEKRRIEKAGSVITPEGRVDGNLNLSRSIGDLRYKKNKSLTPQEHPVTAFPDIKKVARSPEHDFVILACDGIWEAKSSQDVVDFVCEQKK